MLLRWPVLQALRAETMVDRLPRAFRFGRIGGPECWSDFRVSQGFVQGVVFPLMNRSVHPARFVPMTGREFQDLHYGQVLHILGGIRGPEF